MPGNAFRTELGASDFLLPISFLLTETDLHRHREPPPAPAPRHRPSPHHHRVARPHAVDDDNDDDNDDDDDDTANPDSQLSTANLQRHLRVIRETSHRRRIARTQQQAADMPPSGLGHGDILDDDDLEIISSRPRNTTSATNNNNNGNNNTTRLPPLILPHPDGRPPHAFSRQPNHPSLAVGSDGVIDLTAEPDSPVELRPPPRPAAVNNTDNGSTAATIDDDELVQLPPIRLHRHPRRTNSLRRTTPPRLSRSESIMLATQTSFIDLTGDDDNYSIAATTRTRTQTRDRRNEDPDGDFEPPPMVGGDTNTTTTNANTNNSTHAQRRSNRNSRIPALPDQGTFQIATAHHDHLVELDFIGGRGMHYGFASTFARGFGRTLADFLSTDFLAGAAHHAHVHTSPRNAARYPFAHGRPRPPSPPPQMAPIPPARSGFTRDTCLEPTAEDEGERVVICPACQEELAYDPTEAPSAPTGAAKKRKRAVGDHHFWAVKKCGHVYCAECFENRRPTRAHPAGVGFTGPDGKEANQTPSDLRCAVDGCDSKVANKTEWVGIFL